MPLECFEKLLRHPAPAFACRRVGIRRSERRSLHRWRMSPTSSRSALTLIAFRLFPVPTLLVPFTKVTMELCSTRRKERYSPKVDQKKGLRSFPCKSGTPALSKLSEFWNDSEYDDDAMPALVERLCRDCPHPWCRAACAFNWVAWRGIGTRR